MAAWFQQEAVGALVEDALNSVSSNNFDIHMGAFRQLTQPSLPSATMAHVSTDIHGFIGMSSDDFGF